MFNHSRKCYWVPVKLFQKNHFHCRPRKLFKSIVSNKYEHTPFNVRYRNLNVKVHSKSNNIFLLLEELFKLKNARATALVVENNLKSLIFYYGLLEKEDNESFLLELATRYSVDHDLIIKASKNLSEQGLGSGLMLKAEEKLRDVLTHRYVWIFTHLGRLENGVKFLVDLRCDILNMLSNMDAKSPHQLAVQQLNNSLKELLSLWFSIGFLQLQRITWSSPCSLIHKISQYEAVHPVRSWTDMMQRVGPYRRCFVYSHHSMPGEPLVILHVALTKEISDNMKTIIQRQPQTNEEGTLHNEIPPGEEAHNIDAFIFYSISSTQKGLQGIELGNYLIKQAAQELHLEYPNVSKFSTLSPIPSFRSWLIGKFKAATKDDQIFPVQEWEEVLSSLNSEDNIDAWSKLRSMISDNSWIHNETLVKLLKAPLMASCSRYLFLEKRRGYAFESVANFHLRNGAVMWRLNWLADTSPRGLSNSCGLMVNYRYYLDCADTNSLKYIRDKVIMASDQFEKLSVVS